MITQVLPIASGNATQIFITPNSDWLSWIVLRKSSDTFTGRNDAAAYQVSNNDYAYVVDFVGLNNGSEYFYHIYGWNGVSWIDGGPSVSSVPSPNYEEGSADVLEVLRSRLSLGFKVEIAAGNLFHDSNKIPVLLASPTFEDTKWPVVSLHLGSDSSNANQFIGGLSDSDFYDPETGIATTTEGWLSQYQITVVAWSLNADERNALKKAIKRIIIANKPVFEYLGIINLEMTQQNIDDFQTYPAPVYTIQTQLSFTAPSSILIKTNPINAVTVNAIVNGDSYA